MILVYQFAQLSPPDHSCAWVIPPAWRLLYADATDDDFLEEHGTGLGEYGATSLELELLTYVMIDGYTQRRVTSSSGNLTQRTAYDKYGENSSATGEPFQYQGRRFPPCQCDVKHLSQLI